MVTPLPAGLEHGGEQLGRRGDRSSPCPWRRRCRAAGRRPAARGQRIELARLGALDQRPVDDVALLHAAQAAREGEAAVGRRLAGPAALQRRADGIEPAGDVVGGLPGALGIGQDVGLEGAGDRRLLDHRLAGDAARQRQRLHQVGHRAGDVDGAAQVVAALHRAVAQAGRWRPPGRCRSGDRRARARPSGRSPTCPWPL